MKESCCVDDCVRPKYGRGYCKMHWKRWKHHGHPGRVRIAQQCSITGCSNPCKGQGYCNLHYQRFQKTGDPLGVRVPSVEQRFWEKVEILGPDDCWEWLGHRKRHGYGQFSYAGRRTGSAHVYSYELHHGQVPEGMEVLHSCDHPPCVNPAHLSAGTHAENMGQMADRKRWPRKLTDAQMAEIRDSPEIQKVLAKRYGISQGYVSAIKRQYRDGMHRTFTS